MLTKFQNLPAKCISLKKSEKSAIQAIHRDSITDFVAILTTWEVSMDVSDLFLHVSKIGTKEGDISDQSTIASID